jgi:hypothetical protein
MKKEEPKQECTCGICDYYEEQESIQILKEAKENALKQETLEEAARNAIGIYTYDDLRQIAYNAYCKGQLDEPTEGKFNLWIQQFKKK